MLTVQFTGNVEAPSSSDPLSMVNDWWLISIKYWWNTDEIPFKYWSNTCHISQILNSVKYHWNTDQFVRHCLCTLDFLILALILFLKLLRVVHLCSSWLSLFQSIWSLYAYDRVMQVSLVDLIYKHSVVLVSQIDAVDQGRNIYSKLTCSSPCLYLYMKINDLMSNSSSVVNAFVSAKTRLVSTLFGTPRIILSMSLQDIWPKK